MPIGTLDRLRSLAPDASLRGPSIAPARLRVLVVSPVRFFADALASELSRHSHLEVRVWSGEDGAEHPELLLVEMRPPHGFEQLRHFRQRFPGTPIVAVAVEERPDHVVACVEAGAAGYVAVGADVPELVATIERASRGEAICPPEVIGALFRRVAGLTREVAVDPLSAALLTPREQEIAELLGCGLSNKAIARELGIRIPTVKSHVHQVLRKLGATSRLTLAAAARRRQLPPEDLSRPEPAPWRELRGDAS